MARFTEMAMSAISKGRNVGRRRENPITSLYSWYRGCLKLGETHPPRGSVLTRERNPPSGSTNQIAASVAHAIASIAIPLRQGLWCLYFLSLSLSVHLCQFLRACDKLIFLQDLRLGIFILFFGTVLNFRDFNPLSLLTSTILANAPFYCYLSFWFKNFYFLYIQCSSFLINWKSN